MALSRSADPCERNQNSNALIRRTAVDCYSSSAVEMAIKEKRKNLYKRWRFHLRLVSSHFLFLSLPESLAAHPLSQRKNNNAGRHWAENLNIIYWHFLVCFVFPDPTPASWKKWLVANGKYGPSVNTICRARSVARKRKFPHCLYLCRAVVVVVVVPAHQARGYPGVIAAWLLQTEIWLLLLLTLLCVIFFFSFSPPGCCDSNAARDSIASRAKKDAQEVYTFHIV